MFGQHQRIPAGRLSSLLSTPYYGSSKRQRGSHVFTAFTIPFSSILRVVCSPVFSRAQLLHPAGLLRPPQRLPPVGPGRLDPGEDGPPGAAGEPGAEARGAGRPGRGAAKTAHTETLQLKRGNQEHRDGCFADAVF